MSQENADYYFVLFRGKIIGDFRIIWDLELEGLLPLKQVKLHRVYLHKKAQGKGIGKALITWLEREVKRKEHDIIWLDAMNKKPQVFTFYKSLGFQNHSHCFLTFTNLNEGYDKMSQLFKNLN